MTAAMVLRLQELVISGIFGILEYGNDWFEFPRRDMI